jgi:hypothetical protein
VAAEARHSLLPLGAERRLEMNFLVKPLLPSMAVPFGRAVREITCTALTCKLTGDCELTCGLTLLPNQN